MIRRATKLVFPAENHLQKNEMNAAPPWVIESKP